MATISPHDSVPQDRVAAIAYALYIGGIGGPRGHELRDHVAKHVEGRKHRMTPWGIQFLRGSQSNENNNDWIPAFFYQEQPIICGRWILDIEVPEIYDGHPVNCTCFGRTPPKLLLSDRPDSSSDVLTAFLRGERTDPSLDLAHRFSPLDPKKSQTARCMITSLPQELFDLILDHLVPEGQTFHFLRARSERKTVQVVQRFVPEWAGLHIESDASSTTVLRHFAVSNPCGNPAHALLDACPMKPATGSAHLSLAGTCRQLHRLVYRRFYGTNAFIFHLTPNAIHSSVRSGDMTKLRCWSRTVSQQPRALGSLTKHAASFLKNVTLIASLPRSYGSQDIRALTDMVQNAASALASARLERLTVHFQIAPPAQDGRYSTLALPIDILQADVSSDGKLNLRIREPSIEPVRPSNRAQRALRPLMQGPRGVKELELSGSLSDDFVSELERSLKAEQSAGLQQEHATQSGGGRGKKRRRV